MAAPGSLSLLLDALDALAALAGETDRQVIDGLRGRLRDSRLRVLVAGEAKRGKSTLVNALLGRDLLPTGVTPVTALATTVRHGHDEGVVALRTDGCRERFPLAALGDLVTEHGNPGNRRGLASVTVTVDSPWLARGVELVDTPGTGSVYAHNTAEARTALETMDAAVFVLTADPPVSASERELMAEVAGLSVAMFVVLNKADYLASSGGLAEAVEFTAKVAAGATGRPVPIYPMSARAALAPGGDQGVTGFTAALDAYLSTRRDLDLRRSVAGHGRRLVSALRDQALLARQAASMRTGDAAGRVRKFAARLAAASARRQDVSDLAAGESARLLSELNEAARLAAEESTRTVIARLDSLLEQDLRPASTAEIARTGRERLGQFAVEAAESWRSEQSRRLEEGLARLDERLTGDLRAELDAVRGAAAKLLGLDLAVPGPGRRLTGNSRFFYTATDEAGQTELLAGAVRRHLPGESGRRRARAHLRREAADLVPRQIGRARADLQYRLAEATRRLVREVRSRYDDGTGRLEEALRDAAALRDATDAEVAVRDRELAGQLTALDQVLDRLDAAVAVSPQAGVEADGT